MDSWTSEALAAASIVAVKYFFSPKAKRLRPVHVLIEFLGVACFIALFQWILKTVT